ncbi:Transposase zinc-ribbon domain-containing protein [Cryobacterium flavum]|uniref:Transposase zinc-ribbon domain-containing protein n=1 Tax=Cryobacterium flavum TaxID=1424659 RepID=A0A5E9G1U1_9MICO|nr:MULTISPECIES: IS1595 family transposase [Cryobacterium]SDN96379.1 Transposase zinc-ribbon domain-containing protein [Cryobacterium flavum]
MPISPSVRPLSGVDYPSTFLEFQDWFSTDEKCLDYLARLRWPNGFVCPRCAATTSWRTTDGLWMCTACSRRTSVTAGTIFDRTRTPMRTWFAAIWFVTAQKNGVSALGLQRVLGLKSYETAWVWMHKLRRAMVVPERDLLTGTVEVDETFVGGISRGNVGRSSDKVPVIVAAESLGKNRIGRIRLEPTPEGRLTLVNFTQRVVVPGAMIKTDGARELRRLSALGFEHQYFTQLGSTVPAHIDLPAVHRVASLLKRWMIGTMHYGASREQFGFYLDEFTFRFNRRTSKSRGLLFYRLMQQAVITGPHPIKSLVIPRDDSAACDVRPTPDPAPTGGLVP